MMYTPVDHMI